ncbi:MAG: sensor histidine kinase, partial [Longimicrobiales bacterium]
MSIVRAALTRLGWQGLRGRLPVLLARYRVELVIAFFLVSVEAVLIGLLLYERRVRRRTQHLLEERVRLERLVAEVLVEFTNLPTVEIDGALRGALERIGSALQLDRTSLWELSRDGRTFHLASVWVAPGAAAPPSMLDAGDEAPWLDDLRRDGQVMRSWSSLRRRSDGGSSLMLPLVESGTIIGSFAIATLRERREWPDDVATGLRILAETFTTALVRQRSALALKDSEALSSAVLASMSSNVAILDRAGRIVRVNEAWRRFSLAHGVSDERNGFVGESYVEVCRVAAADGVQTAARILSMIEEVLTGRGQGFSLEHPCTTAGAEVWLELRVEPLALPEGGAVVTYTDITPRKAAERDALSRLQVLAHVSRAITLGALSGSLAHELNQPLTAILSNAQAAIRFLALDPPRVSAVGEILHDIASDTRRASEVIRGLRKLLRAEEAEYLPIDINTVVGDAVRVVADDVVIRKTRIELELDEEVPPVKGDAIQLQQVIMNLLLNALDAMEGTVLEERKLGIATSRDAEGRVEIRVADRGPDTSQTALDRIFEPFFTTKAGGLGLGLYIARSIIEAHGGAIRAQKNPD